eukprot:TRINITY_DN33325_c0_g1_i1.p2 TRINITY_DN33325_c0_g1~~TRINITY_DN33325_c0_g1_i1.p2  ORF type:complete len:185 (+),score=21.58 TRINITY_DN33325_c0_g1_i1:23-556(+)
MTEFSIAYNRIGDDAMTQLAEGLSGLHDMHELSLIHNHSGDVGLRALVHVLPSLPKLERLSFGPAADCTDVTVSAEATKELADALPDMADLHVIEMVSDAEGRSSLDEAAAKRPDLRVNCWPAPLVHQSSLTGLVHDFARLQGGVAGSPLSVAAPPASRFCWFRSVVVTYRCRIIGK